MAFKHTTTDADVMECLGGKDYFWAIEKNVGYGYPNLPTDVLLVQFFLNAIDMVETGYVPYVCGDNYIEEDGRFGSQTWARIKQYQKKVGGVADGMVSAARGGSLFAKRSGKVLTIFSLNADYDYEFPQYFYDLKMDRNLPPELCNHFTVPEFEFE